MITGYTILCTGFHTHHATSLIQMYSLAILPLFSSNHITCHLPCLASGRETMNSVSHVLNIGVSYSRYNGTGRQTLSSQTMKAQKQRRYHNICGTVSLNLVLLKIYFRVLYHSVCHEHLPIWGQFPQPENHFRILSFHHISQCYRRYSQLVKQAPAALCFSVILSLSCVTFFLNLSQMWQSSCQTLFFLF